MNSIQVERQVAAPPEVVFGLASDFPNSAQLVQGINKVEMLTDGPVGLGTRFKETRTIFGREASEEMTVTVFEPPRRYVLVAESHGCHYDSELTFTPENGGTKIAMTFDATPLTFFAKIMSVLTRPMLKKMVELCGKDLDDIKARAEAEASP